MAFNFRDAKTTWNNVGGGVNGDANTGLAYAAKSFDKAASGLTNTVDQYSQGIKDTNTQNAVDAIQQSQANGDLTNDSIQGVDFSKYDGSIDLSKVQHAADTKLTLDTTKLMDAARHDPSATIKDLNSIKQTALNTATTPELRKNLQDSTDADIQSAVHTRNSAMLDSMAQTFYNPDTNPNMVVKSKDAWNMVKNRASEQGYNANQLAELKKQFNEREQAETQLNAPQKAEFDEANSAFTQQASNATTALNQEYQTLSSQLNAVNSQMPQIISDVDMRNNHLDPNKIYALASKNARGIFAKNKLNYTPEVANMVASAIAKMSTYDGDDARYPSAGDVIAITKSLINTHGAKMLAQDNLLQKIAANTKYRMDINNSQKNFSKINRARIKQGKAPMYSTGAVDTASKYLETSDLRLAEGQAQMQNAGQFTVDRTPTPIPKPVPSHPALTVSPVSSPTNQHPRMFEMGNNPMVAPSI